MIGISIHLYRWLAWIGFATIKVPYFLSIGPILSPIWMILNLSLGFHLALKKLYELELKLSFKNKFIICTIGIIYFLSEYNPLTKIIVFLIFTFVIVKYINFLKKENLKN